MIQADPSISYDKLAAQLQKDRSTIMRNIRKLRELGILTYIGPRKTGHWKTTLPEQQD